MTEDERRANFRRLETCRADFHEFHAEGKDDAHAVKCSVCGGVVSKLVANYYYYGIRAGFDAAARHAQQESNDIKEIRKRMQADFSK